MTLYEQILCQAIATEVMEALEIDPAGLVEMRCYQAVRQIYDIVSDEALDDAQCFARVEEIVTALEQLGIGGGGRHDFS
jgi:hypothetical protein